MWLNRLIVLLLIFMGSLSFVHESVKSAEYRIENGEFEYYAEAPAYQGSGVRYSLEEFTLHNGCDPNMDPRGTGYVGSTQNCGTAPPSTQWGHLPLENCDSWVIGTDRRTQCVISQDTVNNVIRAAGMTNISDGDTVYVSGGFGA